MTQGEAIEAFLNALDDFVRGNIYEHASDYHSHYLEIIDARVRITDALYALLSGKVE